MSVALAPEVGEVLHSDRAVDNHEAVPPEDVAGDEVLNGPVLIPSCIHRSLAEIIIPTFAAIGLTVKRVPPLVLKSAVHEDDIIHIKLHLPATEPSTIVLRYPELSVCGAIFGVEDWYPAALI